MDTYHGFDLLREQNIPELNTYARLFRHRQTGAELLSLENDDENKVFAIAFTTPPPDSTGLPHIMEHSVLCGSRKYPVKEPFVELLKGSLNTYLNAFTMSDKTVYPVASQNVQDFYNLIDVYLDAVFHPRITPQTLEQEGWHYELDGPDAPLTFKGVVFNEMKGAYSDPENLLGRTIQQALFPDTPYRHDSGGDPKAIPDLTYTQFKRFHETYYHPSNARILFWGDDDPEQRLRITDEYLREFDRLELDVELPLQPRFEGPRMMTLPYDAGEDGAGRKAYVTVNWMLAENGDVETTLALEILSHILIGTPASPLRKALIESGLGEDLTGGGLDADLRQVSFSTGLKGVALEDTSRVEALTFETLANLAAEGIERETVEASLNTVEFMLRERNTGRFPRGVLAMVNALSTWTYGGDPLAPLAFEAPLNAVKAAVERDPRYFEELLRTYFVDNPHRVTLLLTPDPSLREQEDAAERERLAQVRAGLDEAGVFRVIEEAQRLRRLQETPDPPEALATIPTLTLDDLDRRNKPIPAEEVERAGTRVLVHDLFTNGIVYLDLGFNLYALPAEDLPYTRLFGRALLEMGTTTQDYVRLAQRIGRTTGGIAPNLLTSAVYPERAGMAWLFLRGKATADKADALLDILRDVLLTVQLDNRERFRQIVLEEKARLESQLARAGHIVVYGRLKSLFHEADWASEQMQGLDYLFFLRDLAAQIDANWTDVLARLEAIRGRLVRREAALANVTTDADIWAAFDPALAGFLSELPAAPGAPFHTWTPARTLRDEGLVIPAQVNYVGKGANLYDFGHDFNGSMLVINDYLQSTWLWEKIRVQGGAYGGFSAFDRHTGAFAFLSYRDPNLLDTLDVYDRTGDFLRGLEVSQDELTKAIIGTIGQIDAYMLPDAKGYTSMVRVLSGDTDERRQQMRDEVLSTSAADFRRFADLLDDVRAQGAVMVLGGQTAIEEANEGRPGWLTVRRVL